MKNIRPSVSAGRKTQPAKKNPLRKIQIFSNMLSSPEANLNNFAKKHAAKINASSVRMSSLLKDLMSFSVLLRGEEKKLVEVDLNDIVKNVIKDFELINERKKAVVNVSSLPVIQAEPVHMNLLFHNLVDNALKSQRKIRDQPHIRTRYA